MKGVGYGRGYRYVRDDPVARDDMTCLPERFADRDYLGASRPDAPGRSADGPRRTEAVADRTHDEDTSSTPDSPP